MKQALQLKLSQHLTLTPQLQQSIRLLQLSTIELNQEIEQILAENPLLERDDDPQTYGQGDAADSPSEVFGTGEKVQTESLADAFGAPEGAEGGPDFTDRDFSAASTRNRNDDDDEGPSRQVAAAESTLREHLLGQIAVMRLSDLDRGLVGALVEALNEDGYLEQSLEEILEMLPDELELELDDLEVALRLLQACDPPGIGARDLSEALALQLMVQPHSRCRDLAIEICRKHLELLGARDFAQLKRNCRCDDEELKAAHALLLAMNPRPGAQYSSVDTRYITPDVIVRKIKGVWKVGVNPAAVPKLRINRLYADILSRERGRSAPAVNGEATIHTRFQEAKWLLKNVHQRFETIERVAQAIVERQKHFFDHGEVAMRPLVLREIADELGLHESTISRVTTNKYMLTPRGIFELKYFFGSHVATDSGGACSSTAIRALIKQLVTSEDVKNHYRTQRLPIYWASRELWLRDAPSRNTAMVSRSRRPIFANRCSGTSGLICRVGGSDGKEACMNFTVSGHHVSVTPSIHDYVVAKFSRINRHFDHVIDVNVILSVEKLAQKCEVNVHVRGKDIFVETVDENMYAAIDTLADKLDRQILKYKDKAQNHAHSSPKRLEVN